MEIPNPANPFILLILIQTFLGKDPVAFDSSGAPIYTLPES